MGLASMATNAGSAGLAPAAATPGVLDFVFLGKTNPSAFPSSAKSDSHDFAALVPLRGRVLTISG
jgi:hypothetical protein